MAEEKRAEDLEFPSERPVYRWFIKQKDAFEHAQKFAGQDLLVWAKEIDTTGKRKFLVASSKEFWEKYKWFKPEEKCFYEIIPEGSPCRLYFDLEFNKKDNPKHDGEKMVQIFKKCVRQELKIKYEIDYEEENFKVVHLDSSTETKFSAHLIYHLPNAVFKDNSHAGRFVKHVCATIETDETEELREFMIKNSKGEKVIFCDTVVYTKNRNFRLYLSTKYGKNSPLVSLQPNTTNDEMIFKDSLISHFSQYPDLRKLTFNDETSESPAKKPRNDDTPDHTSHTSPYPKIDQFIKENINKGGVQGFIREVTYYEENDIIVYQIGENRWCENIGRHHQSNHIMMVVNVKNRVYYQKCQDSDCEGFKSEELPLPHFVFD